jgi:hypothetical protein
MNAKNPRPDDEVHHMPLPNRLAESIIRDWLDRATNIALASRGELGTEPAERKAIEEMRHLHLADYSYMVVPKLLAELRKAGLLKPEVSG